MKDILNTHSLVFLGLPDVLSSEFLTAAEHRAGVATFNLRLEVVEVSSASAEPETAALVTLRVEVPPADGSFAEAGVTRLVADFT